MEEPRIQASEVEHVARLARLALSDEEKARMRQQLDRILGYIEKLRELDIDGVPPTAHAVPMVNVMRDDEARAGLDPEVMLANAPDRSGEFFRVPRIIED